MDERTSRDQTAAGETSLGKVIALDELDEKLDLGMDLVELWVGRGGRETATLILWVEEMVRTKSLDELRAMVQELREERLQVDTLAKLPGYLALHVLQLLEKQLGLWDLVQLRRMQYGIDPNG